MHLNVFITTALQTNTDILLMLDANADFHDPEFQ